MPTKKRFLEAVDGITKRLGDYLESGKEFSVHIWDKDRAKAKLAVHYLYAEAGHPVLDKDRGDPEHLMVVMTPPPSNALKIYPHRELDVWVCYGHGYTDDTVHAKGARSGFVYDIHSRALVARHIAHYLKTGMVPSVLGDISKPVLQ